MQNTEIKIPKIKKVKVTPEHTDILGQPLSLNSYVAVSYHNMLQICQVIKINPKTIRVATIGTRRYGDDDGHQVYSCQAVLLSGPDALAYILANAGPR